MKALSPTRAPARTPPAPHKAGPSLAPIEPAAGLDAWQAADLQAGYGNAGVINRIQGVSSPGDPAEREADAAASTVAAGGTPAISATPAGGIMRDPEDEVCEAPGPTTEPPQSTPAPTSEEAQACGEDPAERQEFQQFWESPHTATNCSLGRRGNFDLTYDPLLGMALVEVRIFFEFRGASVGDRIAAAFSEHTVEDYQWTDAQKQSFQQDFIAQVSSVWSGRHSFRCTRTDGTLVQTPRWSDVVAGVDVSAVPVEDAGSAHYTVQVEHIPTGEFETSSVTPPSRGAGGSPTGPGTASLDSNDTTGIGKATSPAGVTQRASVHEFGHMLGLQDEYPGTGRATGSTTAQGSTVGGANDARIMSGGEIVEQAHYESIKRALNTACAPVTFDFA